MKVPVKIAGGRVLTIIRLGALLASIAKLSRSFRLAKREMFNTTFTHTAGRREMVNASNIGIALSRQNTRHAMGSIQQVNEFSGVSFDLGRD